MELNYRDVPDPEMLEDEVLVTVMACGICGSDVHGMDGSTGRRRPPLIMGHEASGVIEKVGEKVSGWNQGDRVTFDSTIYPLEDWYTRKGQYNLSDNRKVLGVSPGEYHRNGAFAEYVAVPAHILYRIPDKVSFEEAAMVEPIAVAAHAVNRSLPKIGESAVVVGSGMVGLFVIRLLQLAGVNPIVAIDIDEHKLSLARAYGATHVYVSDHPDLQKEVTALTGNRGADLAFEVVGISETVQMGISKLRKGGKLVLVGNLSKDVNLPLQKVVSSEISILGSCAINGEYETVLNLLESGKIEVKPMLSAVAPLQEGAEWFKRLYKKEEGLNKVLLVP